MDVAPHQETVEIVDDYPGVSSQHGDDNSRVIICLPAAVSSLGPTAGKQVEQAGVEHTDLISDELNDDCKTINGEREHWMHEVLNEKIEEEEEATKMCPNVEGFIVERKQAF